MRLFREIYLYFYSQMPVDIIDCGDFMWTRLDGERSLGSGQVIVQ